jgi:hypothetical protein
VGYTSSDGGGEGNSEKAVHGTPRGRWVIIQQPVGAHEIITLLLATRFFNLELLRACHLWQRRRIGNVINGIETSRGVDGAFTYKRRNQ